jgi:hypothetical protein
VISLVLGKNSAVGTTLQNFRSTEKYIFLDREETRKLLRDVSEIQRFLTRNSVDKVIYLMVDRNTRLDEVENSEVNFQFPIQIAEAISGCKDIDFIWPSSIFCLDEKMIKNNPYLLSQNLAFKIIRVKNKGTNGNYSRIYLPQIYGKDIYRKHQPFLYKIRDLVQQDNDVYLINGRSTYRNFIHESDIPGILVDSKSWVQKEEIACLFEESLSWFEITDSIIRSFKSQSKIFDQIDDSVKFPEYKYSNLEVFNVGQLYSLRSFEKVIGMGMF